MTRPAYDPFRPPAPPFPRARFEAAGLDAAAIDAVAETYAALDHDGKVAFSRDATRVPNEELSRRYADGTDAGASPALLSPEEIANQHKAGELKQAASNAGLSTSGTKVDVAARLVEAGAADTLPPVAPPTPTPPAETPTGTGEAPSAPQTAPEAVPAPTPPAPAPDATAGTTAAAPGPAVPPPAP